MKHVRFALFRVVLPVVFVSLSVVALADVVELNFVHAFNHFATDVQQQIVDDFNKRHPQLQVSIEPIAWDKPIEVLKLRTAAGVAPDILSIGSDTFSSLVADGGDWFTDITPYIARDMAKDRFDIPDAVWAATTFEGRVLAMSQRISTYVMFYNRDMFANVGLQAPPSDWFDASWNWDTFRNAVSKLTLDKSGDGVPDIYGFANSVPTRFFPWVFQAGGDYLNETYDDFILDQPAGIAAIEHITSMIERRYMGGGFLSETAAMYTGIPTEMQAAEGKGMRWDFAPLPQGPAGPAAKMLTIAVGIPAGTAHRDEAWEFLKHYMSAEYAALQNQADVLPQARMSVVRNRRNYAPYVKTEHINVIAQALELGHVYRYFHPRAPEIYATIDEALRSIFALRSDPSTALAAIRPKVMSLLKER